MAAPIPSPAESSTSATAQKPKSDTSTFADEQDFIAFELSDVSSDDELPPWRKLYDGDKPGSRDKGKGKARDGGVEDGDEKRPNGLSRQFSPRIRGRDAGKRRRRSRERDGDETRRDGSGKNADSRTANGSKSYDLVFDFNDGYENKKQRTDAASRKCPWIHGVDYDGCNTVSDMLHREVEAFVKWVSPTPVEDEVRGLIVQLISKAVTSAFPDAQVLPFGSFATKLYLPLGDIDLVILSESMAYSDKLNVLRSLASTLKRNGITSNVTIIGKAKVPIVKFITSYGRFNVDISVNQSNGLVSGKIINDFLRHTHHGGDNIALRALVLITKAFLTQRSMNEVFTGGLGSYSIVCLAVSFLQMHPKIRQGEIDPSKNLGVLVMEFFELYGWYFNFEEVGISVRDGGTYFSKRQRGWWDYYKAGLLSIEDPVDPTNDISKGSYAFPKVRASMAGAYGMMSNAAYALSETLRARREGRYFQLRGEVRREDMSILGSVMGITQETVNHRRLVQEVYDRRTLHTLLGIQPRASVIVANGHLQPNGKAAGAGAADTRTATRSVENAWGEADMVLDSDAESSDHGKHARDDEDEDDEDGRYEIGRQAPPRKRRRTGKPRDAHTVYLSATEEDDDDDGDELELISAKLSSQDSIIDVSVQYDEADSILGEELEYASDVSSAAGASGSKSDLRRSYWLSKSNAQRDVDSS